MILNFTLLSSIKKNFKFKGKLANKLQKNCRKRPKKIKTLKSSRLSNNRILKLKWFRKENLLINVLNKIVKCCKYGDIE
jgi:hypothetical protein